MPLLPEYKAKHLAKINSIREARSQPDIIIQPVLNKSQVLFVTAASRHDEPNSCYNCTFYNEDKARCVLMPQDIEIKKFTYGQKPIEYWPVCGYQTYGEPKGQDHPVPETLLDPDYAGLSWINAPRVGQKCGGTNCGGGNGGDDCDYWEPAEKVETKREARVGVCRVLQVPTANGDCCAAWNDDDLVTWQEAQAILKGNGNE